MGRPGEEREDVEKNFTIAAVVIEQGETWPPLCMREVSNGDEAV